MVSEVRAHTRAPALDVLKALFPCASITGAPKIRTMELIRELEPGPRGVYTGTVGYLAPDGTAQFNVAIRTAVVGRRRAPDGGVGQGWARYGTGGGIVWDSVAADEYRECLSKALILDPDRGTSSPSSSSPSSSSASSSSPSSSFPEDADFHLFETLLYRPRSGFFLLDRHLERLEASARALGFPWDGEAVRRELEALGRGLPPERARVRLEWHRRDGQGSGQEGWARAEAWPFPCAGRTTWTAVLDDRPVDADDPFLRHKTSRRERYEAAAARFPAADEVILHNGSGQLTETTRANLVLRFADRFLTPPVEAGLLPGTYRAALLARGRLEEAELPVAALDEADAIFAVNSLRGWIRLDSSTLETIATGTAQSRATAGPFARAIRPSAEPGKQTPTPFPTVHGDIR
jgi:para-aminobenzoate synthetase/4-amino-4-deoxychorismate lyase